MAQTGGQTNGQPISDVKEKHAFEAAPPNKHIERMQRARQEHGEAGIALSELWVGIAAEKKEDGSVDVGFACHDGTYNVDFAVHNLSITPEEVKAHEQSSLSTHLPADKDGQELAIADYLVRSIREYEQKNSYKFLGAGISQEVVQLSPQTPARLWTELDMVPVVIPEKEGGSLRGGEKVDAVVGVDELADSLSRKCLSYANHSS